MRQLSIVILLLVYYVLHQDVWLWTMTRPLTFGFVPPGLLYHAVYTLGAAGVMALLVKWAWPHDLERWADSEDDGQ